jgi:dTMP kinase
MVADALLHKALQGRFVVLEGGEGAGKTTQLAMLQRVLAAGNLPVTVAREPGGTDVGEFLRPILKGLHGRYPDLNAWHALCGYNFARMAFVFDVVRPALAAGTWVLADRFAHSTIVYQGDAGGLPADVVQAVTAGVVGDNWPDLTVVLDVPPELGLARGDHEGGTRFEDKGLAFHTQVRAGYHRLVKEYPAHTVMVDASQPFLEVHAELVKLLNLRFGLALVPLQA